MEEKAYGHLGGGATPWCPLWPIFTPRPKNSRDGTLFRDLFFVPPPPRFQDRGCQTILSRHPVGERIDLRELLHHHDRFLDEP